MIPNRLLLCFTKAIFDFGSSACFTSLGNNVYIFLGTKSGDGGVFFKKKNNNNNNNEKAVVGS